MNALDMLRKKTERSLTPLDWVILMCGDEHIAKCAAEELTRLREKSIAAEEMAYATENLLEKAKLLSVTHTNFLKETEKG